MQENNFFDSNRLTEIKIFQIDKSFYELRQKGTNEAIVNYIVDEHKAKVGDFGLIGEPLPNVEQDGTNYYSYVYNEDLKEAYWEKFLPTSITQHHNFEIQKLSFVLFACVNTHIFAIIGGGGIRVIKRYLNHRFGIELFEHLTIPCQDLINSISTRSISGRITGEQDTFREGQTLADALSFTRIPTKINIILREDIKDTIFDFINFSTDNVFLEVGSYFLVKHYVSFKQLHVLFGKVDEIMSNSDSCSISSFERVRDKDLISNKFLPILIQRLNDDMVDRNYSYRSGRMIKFDIDFIHPSKLQEFYECDSFQLFKRNCKIPFYVTSDKTELYSKGLKHLYEILGPSANNYEFGKIILGVRVQGYRDGNLITKAMFVQHLTCEITYYGLPVFKIDNDWYTVKNDFVDTVNKKCIGYIDNNKFPKGIVNVFWNKKDTEGQYNDRYKGMSGFIVFDKVLGNNIEMCDLMYENAENIYLIHVKDGFDAKMRDLSNQILISANRLKTDIDSDNAFLTEVAESYNSRNEQKLDVKKFIGKFKSGKTIHFVMAYRSKHANIPINERILKSKSNIAKYSLISCYQEMAALFPLKVFDIADIKSDTHIDQIFTILDSINHSRAI
jgi:hypothetical protein